ncbi:MAG: hydroxyacid dehydrogenase [Deltaproteobacteria bacterium]|nr:hydroxyacid dehydrogenase [Deltaproteobacteria bacterium]MBW2119197.1 hydroxyacid dehydrogenase [Deltaproteobacteria bacterium]MBW2342562.1 hydroxyacid dehydrogenase [Deltaproteobacteria bacterium]
MRIVYLGSDFGFKALKKELGGLATAEHVEASSGSVAETLIDAHALLDASMKVHITNEMIKKAENLEIISCATTGSDHIDREELEKRSIPVRTLKEDRDLLLNLTPAAELSWALLMVCARKLPAAFDHVKAGQWVRELFPGIMLRGKRIGIIGCGRIGGWMGRYAKAFGMEVVGYDPYVDPLPEGFVPVILEDLMQTSDFITVHVHLTEETRGLVSRECLEMVKPGAILINTSRGAVVDESALVEALQTGRLGGAGLDVIEGEPDIDQHPLVEYARTHDNLLITPHCGGFSPDAVALVCAHATKKIIKELGLDS